MTITKPIPEFTDEQKAHFWSKVDIRGSRDCWNWKSPPARNGYGQIAYSFGGQKRTLRSNRTAWVLTNGPIPEGQYVLHECDNRICCNPSHLFLGTHLENIEDMRAKQRSRHGMDHWNSKHTREKADCARELCAEGMRQKDVAVLLGMHQSTVSQIWRKKIWFHEV